MNENLFTGTPDADYLNHVKYPDAELKNWKDFTGALQEKEFLSKKHKEIYTLAEQAKASVLTAHSDELEELGSKLGDINTKLNEFLENHESDFKASPVMNLDDYEVIAETKTKYKIKRKKETTNAAGANSK